MTDLTRRRFLVRVPLVVAGTVAAAEAARSDVIRTWVRRVWPGFGAGTLRQAPPVWPPVGVSTPDAFYAEWPVMHYGPPMTNLLDTPAFRRAIHDAFYIEQHGQWWRVSDQVFAQQYQRMQAGRAWQFPFTDDAEPRHRRR